MISWKRNLAFIWISQFLAMLGMSAIVPFLPLYIRELGVTSVDATATWSGWIFSGPFFISFFLTPIWGNVGDRFGRKLVSLRAVFGLGLALVLIGFAQSPIQLLLFRFLQGGLSGFSPAAMALVAANTPEEKNGYALGMLQTATATGTVLGPLIGGILADIIGYRYVFFIVAGLMFITGIFFSVYVKEAPRNTKEEKHYTILENWKFTFSDFNLRHTFYLIFLTSFAFQIIRPIFVLFLEEFPMPEGYFTTITGIIYGIAGIFTAVASPLWGKMAQKRGTANIIMTASIITGTMYLVHLIVTSVYWLAPVRAFMGFGYGGLLPIMFTEISAHAPNDRKSGIMGIGSSAQILGSITGPVTSGAVAAAAGLKMPFVISAVSLFLVIYIAYRLKRGKLVLNGN